MPLFNPENREKIKQAIIRAEQETSGEIRVCAEEHCPEDVLDRAAWYFDKLHMQKTSARNGVLIYVAIADHQLAIIGDSGIHSIVGPEFWNEARDAMIFHFRRGDITQGIISGVEKAGEALRKYFPGKGDGRNELPDDVIIGNKGLPGDREQSGSGERSGESKRSGDREQSEDRE